MAGQLRAAGFTRVIEGAWYDAHPGRGHRHPLSPFLRRATLAGAARDPDLRNWGNTYLIQTPQLSAWVLIDSGNDHLGRMSDVGAWVKDSHGPVDVVLSNLIEFGVGVGSGNPLYIQGHGEYWLALDPNQMRRFRGLGGQVITLGPVGVAEVCTAVGASQFLPYAGWWTELGTPSAGEAALLAQLARELERSGGKTAVHSWHVGDGWVRRSTGQFHRRPCLRPRDRLATGRRGHFISELT